MFDYAFSLDELNIKEECWIHIYDSCNRKKGYNFRRGGDNYKFSDDSNTLNGTEVICINTNKKYKSISEASRLNNLSTTYINNSLSIKRNKTNTNKYLFRNINDLDSDKSYKRCCYCGKNYKLKKIKRGRYITYNFNSHYCTYCSNKKRFLDKGMTKINKGVNK